MDSASIKTPYIERRQKPRMSCSYPTIVQGFNAMGLEFEEMGTAVNMSRNGVFVILNRPIPECNKISVQITLFTEMKESDCSKLKTTGTVVRNEPFQDGKQGVAINFHNYRIL